MQPSVDYTTVRSGAELSAGRTRESVAQLLATLHLSVRDRFRLILQRVDTERESSGPRSDYTREVGSLLFTHERSLTRRFDAGISYTRAGDQDSTAVEGAEVFVKFQWGISSTGGFHW